MICTILVGRRGRPGTGNARCNDRVLKGTRFFIFFISGWLVFSSIFDPMGYKSVFQRHSENLANFILGNEEYWYSGLNQNKSTVILLRDQDLINRGATWPPSYDFHAQVLMALKAYQADAVFIDLLFIDKRDDDTLEFFIDTLCDLVDSEVKVFLAIPDPRFGDEQIRKELRNTCAELVVAPKQTESGNNTNKNRTPADYNAIAPNPRVYDLAVQEKRSAALALYESSKKELQAEAQLLPLHVFWSSKPSRVNEELFGCEGKPFSPLQAIGMIITDIGRLDTHKMDCAYTPTLTVTKLLTTSSSEEVEALIKGRAILYGADLVGIDDVVYPPTHLPLPGVYLHAMALDNLLTFNDRYKRVIEPWPLNKSSVLNLMVLLLLTGLFVYRHPLNKSVYCSEHDREGHSFIGTVAYYTAIIGVAVTAVSVSHFFLDLATPNWIGFLSVPFWDKYTHRFVDRTIVYFRYQFFPIFKVYLLIRPFAMAVVSVLLVWFFMRDLLGVLESVLKIGVDWIVELIKKDRGQ